MATSEQPSPSAPRDPSVSEKPSRRHRPGRVRLSRPTVLYTARRVLAEFSRDGGTDQAAKLTYFMVLSIAPTLLAVFSLATLVLTGLQDQIVALVEDALSDASAGSGEDSSLGAITELVEPTLSALLTKTSGGVIGLIIGIATALWSASAYVKAYSRVANGIYHVPEGRGPIRMNGTMLLVTLGLVVALVIIAVSLLLNQQLVGSLLGPFASHVGLGGLLAFLTDTFLPVWAWLKWPVVALLLFVMLSLLYWAAPNIRKPFRLISPGGVFAVIGIAVAGVAVAIYMAKFASYSSYGAIGGLMAVLFALWVMNIVVIMGAEVDAEYQRATELESGRPAEDTLTAPMRADAGAAKKDAKYEAIVDAGREIRLQNLHRDVEAYTGPISRIEPEDPDDES
jgi:membrane protein